MPDDAADGHAGADGRAEPSVSAGSYVLLAGGSVGYFLFLFAWFLLPAFLTPIIADLGLTGTQAGIVTGAIPLSYIPLALVSGLVIDRIGAPNAIGIGLVVLGAAHAVRAGATGFVSVLVPTLLLGVGGTGLTFGLPKLVADLFPPERSGSMSSVYLVGSALGTAAAFGVGRPTLGPLAGGWRPLFLAAGVGIVGFGVCWTVGATLLWRRVDCFSGEDGESENASFTVESLRRDAWTVLSHPEIKLLVLVGTMRLLVNHGLQAWLATALELRGLAVGLAATVTTLYVVARIGGTVTVSPLSDRLGARRPAVVACGVLGTVGAVGVAAAGGSVPLTVAAVALVGVAMGGLSPLVRVIPIELDGIGPRLTATANGLVFTVGEVGGFAGPFLIGGLRDHTGSFVPGFALLAAGSAVVVVAGYAMTEPSSGGPGG